MSNREKEGGETKIQKSEYDKNEASFLDEISIFDNYLKAVIW